MARPRKVVVLHGDQTGEELLHEALRVLDPTVVGVGRSDRHGVGDDRHRDVLVRFVRAKAADYAVGGYAPYEDCDRCGPLAHDFGWRRPWHRFERETVIERPAIVERRVIIERPVIERRVVIERPAIVERPAVVIHRAMPRVAIVPGYDCGC